MNQSLKPGENRILSQGQVQLTQTLDASLDINLTAVLVTDTSKVPDDRGLAFFKRQRGYGALRAAPFLGAFW